MLFWRLSRKGPKRRPDSGEDHAAVPVGHKVYSFGFGGFMFRFQIDVQVFDTLSLRWVKLSPVTHEAPRYRRGHTAVLIEHVIYLWGGYLYRPTYCDVLYAFNVDAHRWFKPHISGTVPEAREGHSAFALGKVMYIYGGCRFGPVASVVFIDDMYKLDTTTMAWSLINMRGTQPGLGYSATVIGAKMLVFVLSSRYPLTFIEVFDTETNCWLNTVANALPERRQGHSTFTYNDEMYVFGGLNCNLNLNLEPLSNDLWKFSLETRRWKKVEPKGSALCSKRTMSCCLVGNRVFLFGGKRDGLYILDFSPSLKTLCRLAVIEYGLEQSGLPHNIRWELATMTTTTTTTTTKYSRMFSQLLNVFHFRPPN